MFKITQKAAVAIAAAVSLCAGNAQADSYYYNTAGGTANLGSEKVVDSKERFIVRQGTVNVNTGASIKSGGNTSSSCNFIGVDENSPAAVNINGGTLWFATSNGSGYLGVGNNDRNQLSTLTLNSGILKVDAVLRSAVYWDDSVAATSSGTITINGGEATVGTIYMGAKTVKTGTSTLVLNGGTLTTGSITFRSGNGQVFTWGDGTLIATKANIFNVQAFDASNTKTRTMEVTGNPAIFNTAGYAQSIPAFTGTGKLRLTGGGAVSFEQSTLPYGLVLDGIVLNFGKLHRGAPQLTVPSLEITGPVAISVDRSASLTGRYPLIECTSSLDGVSLGQVTVAGGAGTLVREGNTIYLSLDSAAPPTLIHRWSFNGDYTDSVGGITGTANGNVTFTNDNTAISLAGGSKGTSWVELNPDKSAAILPAGNAPFTIEMWTTLRVRTNYSAWFTLGRKDNTGTKGLMVAFHNPSPQIKSWDNSGPTFQMVGSDLSEKNILMGRGALVEGGTYHIAIVVTPCGDGVGATVEGYVHDSAGAHIGVNVRTVTDWTASSLIRESFALGRNFWNDPDPQADYDEVRVWNGALSISQIEANIASGPDAIPVYAAETINDPFFRYDFTNGTRVFTGNNGADPAGTGAGNVAVNGPNGANTAVHPKGYGSISDGDNKLNADWTIAMSVKCCNTEKGVILSVGGNGTLNKKQFVVATSSTNGKLYVPIFQKWGSSNKNIPAITELTGLGDTTNSFHTLVAVHSQGNPYNLLKSGSITLYWDGCPVGSLDSAYQSGDRPYANGFQLCSAHGGFGSDLSAYSDLSGNNNLAFQDVRFFDRALSAEEARLYANAFPPTVPEGIAANTHLLHRWSFNGDLNDTGTVGGKDATLMGTAKDSMTYINDNTEISLTDGSGVDRSWISLGDNIIPADLGDTPFTIELWTALRSRDTWRPCFGFGVDQDYSQAGLHFAYHSNGGKPIFKPITAAASGTWQGENNYNVCSAAFPLNEKCHVAFTVAPDGKGNSYVSAYIHKADGTLVGSGAWPIGSWTTSKIVQSAFMLGRSMFSDANPQASFDEVRVWKTALTKAQIEENIALGPDVLPDELQLSTLEDFLFRYDFTSGAKVYSHNRHATEPTAEWSGYTAVNGPDGYGTAVHACGTGTITGGDTKLNEDWTLAMSVKPCDVEKGVLLCLGRCDTSQRKELAICSSSTPGKIHIAAIQRYGGGSAVNVPLTLNPTGLGDTTNAFHTLIAVHEANKGTKKFSDRQETGLITFYWDGAPIGTIDTGSNGGERLFENGFRFSALRTGLSGYNDLTGNPDAALRDVRFFTRALEACEIASYASSYPVVTAAVCDVDDYYFRHNFATGKLAVEGDGFTDAGLAGTGKKVMGGVDGSGYASFPNKAGYGTVNGGLNRDWTLAMSVKAPVVESGKNGIMLTLGGVETGSKKAFTICSTSDSTGGLFIAIPQRYGSAESALNTCQARISLSGLGDITKEYHSLVIVHARNQKNDANAWQTGTYGIYWDGKYVNSIVNTDSRSLQFMDNLRYGAIYNRTLSGDGSTLQPFYVEPELASGLAFQDVRFYTKILTSAEARAYAAEYPVSEQAKTPGFTILIR